jgi:hypothetical protein
MHILIKKINGLNPWSIKLISTTFNIQFLPHSKHSDYPLQIPPDLWCLGKNLYLSRDSYETYKCILWDNTKPFEYETKRRDLLLKELSNES